MTFKIQDGNGSGRTAGVDTRYRLLTASIIRTESEFSTATGLKYNINTGYITLTNALKTSVLYVMNNDDRDMIISNFIYNTGFTAGTGNRFIDVIRNPKNGDIITNQNNVDIGIGTESNLNYGSSLEPLITAYKGASGEAVFSDGQESVLTVDPNPSGRILISPGGGVILPKGSSIGFNYTPPTGNISQICNFALNVYFSE